MIETMPVALSDALSLLTDLHRDGARPDEADVRLRDLRTRHPEIEMDLLSEIEPYDGSVHYDVLLRAPGEGTISIAVSPEPSLPWPMRGAQRWSEGHLMRVNDHLVRVSQAVALMDFVWEESPVAERLVNAMLVDEELRRNPIELSPEQIRRAMDAFRRRRGVLTAEDTLRWLRERGLSADDLEGLVTHEARIVALRDRIAGDRADMRQELFRQWLDERRREATVEWYWGPPGRAGEA